MTHRIKTMRRMTRQGVSRSLMTVGMGLVVACSLTALAGSAHGEDYGGGGYGPPVMKKRKVNKAFYLINKTKYDMCYWLAWDSIHTRDTVDYYGEKKRSEHPVYKVEGRHRIKPWGKVLIRHVPKRTAYLFVMLQKDGAWTPYPIGVGGPTLPVIQSDQNTYKVMKKTGKLLKAAPRHVAMSNGAFSAHRIAKWEPPNEIEVVWKSDEADEVVHEHKGPPAHMPTPWTQTAKLHEYRGLSHKEVEIAFKHLKAKGWRPTDFKPKQGTTSVTYDMTLVKKKGPDWAWSIHVEPARWSGIDRAWKDKHYKDDMAGAYKVAGKAYRWAIWIQDVPKVVRR